MKTFTKTLIAICLLLGFTFAQAQPVANAGTDAAICAGGSVTIGGSPTASGGNSPYTYVWSDGLVGANPTVAPAVTTTYYVTVMDMMGMTGTDSVTVTVNQLPVIDISATAATCYDYNNGAACVNVTSGTAPFTYTWAQVTETTSCITGLHAGTYDVTVADIAGCEATANVVVYQPAAMQLTHDSATPASCAAAANGQISVSATGGTAPYQYGLNWGPMQPVSTFAGLSEGTYIVQVLDVNGCEDTIMVAVNSLSGISLSLQSQTNVSCFDGADGAICITAANGTQPYSYTWSPLGPNASCINGLSAGTYALTVVDAANCSASASYVVLQPTAIQLSGAVTPAGCGGQSTGSVDLTVTGGTPPYNYNWSDGELTEDAFNLSLNTYVVTVTDMNGCTTTASFTVNAASSLHIDTAFVTKTTCSGSFDGAIDITVSGSTTTYYYSWTNGTVLEDAVQLGVGMYTVTVTDDMACSVIATYSVESYSSLVLDSITATPVLCYGGSNGSACVYVSGGVGGYNYSWNTSPNIPTACTGNFLQAGNYTTTVADANGCYVNASITVTEPTALVVYLQSATGGVLPDTLTTIYSGGTPPYVFLGSNATTVEVMYIGEQPQASCFSARVDDANGCAVLTDTVCYDCNTPDCIWPGDADNDGVADNNDLLPIGLGYGATGLPRMQQDILWVGRRGISWLSTPINGINGKYIDCDGNGTINADDTLAIVQNFGLTHSKGNGQGPWRANAPVLYVDIIPDTTQAGDTMYANLYLGDATINATNVYGLAFTLNYDVNVVDTSRTQMEFADSWLGTSSDKISLSKDLKQGQIKCAVTRIDHTNRSGSGQIARASFVITTDNINGKDLSYYGMRVWITDLVVVDKDGLELEVNEGQDSSNVEFEPTGIGEVTLNSNDLKLQPNPANDMVQIAVTKELIGGVLKLYDVQGRALTEIRITNQSISINTASLTSGIYIVHINTTRGTITKRLIVAH